MTNNEIIKFLQSKQIPQCGDKVYTADEEYEAYQRAIDALEQQPITTTNNDEPITVIYPTTVCDDVISREELLKAIDTWDKFGYTETGCFVRITKEIDNYVPYVHLEDVITAIQKLPPVTQKSGKWIETEYHRWRCSVCREKGISEWDNIHDVRTNFCPDCGARMVEPQESEDKE